MPQLDEVWEKTQAEYHRLSNEAPEYGKMSDGLMWWYACSEVGKAYGVSALIINQWAAEFSAQSKKEEEHMASNGKWETATFPGQRGSGGGETSAASREFSEVFGQIGLGGSRRKLFAGDPAHGSEAHIEAQKAQSLFSSWAKNAKQKPFWYDGDGKRYRTTVQPDVSGWALYIVRDR